MVLLNFQLHVLLLLHCISSYEWYLDCVLCSMSIQNYSLLSRSLNFTEMWKIPRPTPQGCPLWCAFSPFFFKCSGVVANAFCTSGYGKTWRLWSLKSRGKNLFNSSSCVENPAVKNRAAILSYWQLVSCCITEKLTSSSGCHSLSNPS